MKKLINSSPWRSGRFAPFQARTHQDRFGHEHNRTVVITVETQPNFTSGAAVWTPDEVHTWFKLPQVSGYWVVDFANPEAAWFVGNNGQILKITF
jgi:hypothetical protein